MLTLSGLLLGALAAWAQDSGWRWYEVDAQRNVRVNLYLFWSRSCPKCPNAVQFTNWLRQRHPWVNVYAYEITGNPANRDLYQRMAASLNRPAGQTPAFFYCKQMEIGYHSYEQTGRRIEQSLIRWYEALQNHYRPHSAALAADGLIQVGLIDLAAPLGWPPEQEADPPPPPDLPVEIPPEEDRVYVPGWGEVEAGSLSLPALTLILAGCDAFNPCAFFVLLLLLSLLTHGRSKSRMLIVGGVFVFFSGLMYFLFMAAWLNLFVVLGHLEVITAAAGVLAVLIGLLNVKDFFWFKRGPTLSISEGARHGLFRRMTRLINASSLPSLVVGAAALAAAANLYELLCTSGFPMVYTRVLTLRHLSAGGYYGYLLLYNLIYVMPMALIVLGFAMTLGARKLTEYESRVLKLLSGVMMLTLGLMLVFRPEVLHTLIGTITLLFSAVGLTAVVVLVDRWLHGGCNVGGGPSPRPSRLVRG